MRNEEDIELHSYQDDLDTDDNTTDPLMSEQGDDISRELGVPSDELADELDKQENDEDRSSMIEDFDDDLDDENY